MQVRHWKRVYTLHPYSQQKSKIINWWLLASGPLSPRKKTQTGLHRSFRSDCGMQITSFRRRLPPSTPMKSPAPKSSSDARCTSSNTHSSSKRRHLLKSRSRLRRANGARLMTNSVWWLSCRNRWRLVRVRSPARRPTSSRCQPLLTSWSTMKPQPTRQLSANKSKTTSKNTSGRTIRVRAWFATRPTIWGRLGAWLALQAIF